MKGIFARKEKAGSFKKTKEYMNGPSSNPSPTNSLDAKVKSPGNPQGDGVTSEVASATDLNSSLHQAEPPLTPEVIAMEIVGTLVGRPDSMRHDICLDLLKTAGCRAESVDFGLGKNIVCTFSENPTHRIVLGAHYDRVEEAPGANDNGAAVAQLVMLACELCTSGVTHDDLTIVLFDNEEIMADSPEASGSRNFAQYLRDRGCTPEKIVVLDVTGVGDTVILSSEVQASGALRSQIRRELDSCYIPSVEMWTPNSDSLMFNEVGFDCILLCTLPSASLRLLEPTAGPTLWNQESNKFPDEWLKLHTERDDLTSISEEAFVIMRKALRRIAEIPEQ